jgi:hypothetical protein
VSSLSRISDMVHTDIGQFELEAVIAALTDDRSSVVVLDPWSSVKVSATTEAASSVSKVGEQVTVTYATLNTVSKPPSTIAFK